MKLFAATGFALLLGSLPVAAQRADSNQGKTILVSSIAPSGACPIGMRVRQVMSTGMLAVKDGGAADRAGTESLASRLRLNLGAWHPAEILSGQIKEATVTVHGLNGKPGMAPMVTSGESSAEITRTVHVTFTPDDDKSFRAELVLPRLIAANRVDLKSVTYADGSTWKLTGREGCHAATDPLMLIAAQ
jgi:hypothetical protein